MRDTFDEVMAPIACPDCGSENIEATPGGEDVEAPDYRCLDCGTEFDDGGEPVLAYSNAP